MTFVQIVDCHTDKVDDMNRLLDKWVSQTHGKRTATHATVARDRADTHHVVEILEFPSYEEAMRNSNLPETNRIFEEMVALCEMPPTFTDLDVVRDEQLNKRVCRRFFEILAGDLNQLDQVLTEDYRDHDPLNEQEVRGIDSMRANASMYQQAFGDFGFTVQDQIAEGDRVTTRWTWKGTHRGDFIGVKPTNQRVTMSGMTLHQLRDGKICEGWWNYDILGALRLIGAVELPSVS
jgi:steroid delta-isomerase-like uncharacterized protein